MSLGDRSFGDGVDYAMLWLREKESREALEAENERLNDLHRKAVAEAAILLVEKDEYKEEVEQLRETLRKIKEEQFGEYKWIDDLVDAALAQTKEDGPWKS